MLKNEQERQVALGVCLLLLSSACIDRAERPPNILLIVADDLGAGELGSYGDSPSRTPRLDRMAREGMRFETAYTTPLCTPSRVLLMTGRYGFRTGWYGYIEGRYVPEPDTPEWDLGAREVTFADVLAGVDYRTALAGKWQLPGSAKQRIYDTGFDTYLIWRWKHDLVAEQSVLGKSPRYWNPVLIRDTVLREPGPGDYGPDLFTDFLIDFMRGDRTRPFFAYYPMVLVHRPWDPTPDPELPGAKTRRGLNANVTYMDHLVGRLLDTLDETGLSESTLVLFTADNGTGRHGKAKMNEWGARVPLIARWPGKIPAGVVTAALTDHADILPTLADFAGAQLPEDRAFDGASLKPVLLGETTRHREWIFSYLNKMRMLRDERWLLDSTGALWDCAGCRESGCCRRTRRSAQGEPAAARKRLTAILERLPAPEGRSKQKRRSRR